MSKQQQQEFTLDKIEDKIKDLKNKFCYIKEIKELITNILVSLDSKMSKVDTIYEELSNINKVDYLYIFGLDSLNFQKLYIRIEMDYMIKNYILIINRFYCNYYKLFNIIKIYIFKNIKDKKILDNLSNLKTYPKYNDINIYQKYDFETITDIFQDIINLINILNDYAINEKQSMNNLKNKQSIGLKINTFIYTYQSNYEEILNKILLFTRYCLFFTNNNIDYLLKYQKKLQLFLDQINEEIKLENVINSNVDNVNDINLPFSPTPTPISNSISPNEKSPEDIKLLYQEKTFNNKLENSNKIIENQNENIKISINKDIQNDENISNNQTITNSLKKLKNIASIIKNNNKNKKKSPELIPIISQNINENLQNNIKKDDNINKIDNNLLEINNNIDHENNNEIKDNQNINNNINEDNQNINNNINEDNQNINEDNQNMNNNNINEDNQNMNNNNQNIDNNNQNIDNVDENNQNIDNNNQNIDNVDENNQNIDNNNQNIDNNNKNINENINEDNQNIDNNNENINENINEDNKNIDNNNQNIDNNNQNINEEDNNN